MSFWHAVDILKGASGRAEVHFPHKQEGVFGLTRAGTRVTRESVKHAFKKYVQNPQNEDNRKEAKDHYLVTQGHADIHDILNTPTHEYDGHHHRAANDLNNALQKFGGHGRGTRNE